MNASATEKPIITNNVGEDGIDNTENENIFISDNPKQCAEKRIYWLKNQEAARKMGENGSKLSEKKYDW